MCCRLLNVHSAWLGCRGLLSFRKRESDASWVPGQSRSLQRGLFVSCCWKPEATLSDCVPRQRRAWTAGKLLSERGGPGNNVRGPGTSVWQTWNWPLIPQLLRAPFLCFSLSLLGQSWPWPRALYPWPDCFSFLLAFVTLFWLLISF